MSVVSKIIDKKESNKVNKVKEVILEDGRQLNLSESYLFYFFHSRKLEDVVKEVEIENRKNSFLKQMLSSLPFYNNILFNITIYLEDLLVNSDLIWLDFCIDGETYSYRKAFFGDIKKEEIKESSIKREGYKLYKLYIHENDLIKDG